VPQRQGEGGVGGYVDPLARCLNTAEMLRAVRALGVLALGAALEWLKTAAGGWGSLDYGDVAGLVNAARRASATC
jgi:hypothetical protein